MTKRTKLIRKLAPLFIILALISLACFSVYAAIILRNFHVEQTRTNLEAMSHSVGEHVRCLMAEGRLDEIDPLAKKIGRETATRLTVILPDGVVLSDSGRDPASMENHADRPEIIEALRSGQGTSTRYSSTTRREMMYVAVAVELEGRVAFTMRSSLPVATMAQSMKAIYADFFLGAVLIVLLAVLLSVFFSRQIVRPLEELTAGAEQFAAGDFSRRLPVPDSAEIGELAETMNRMAGELDARLSTVLRQRNELQAVLASMVEGVMAIDPDQTIISINQACGEIFGLEPKAVEGASLQEAVRNRDLHDFVGSTLSCQAPCETEITLHREGDRFLQAHGTQLLDDQGERIGALVVFHDVTNLRRLENMRRDFVANVSHELKTPITSIKGFVETLIHDNPEDQEKRQRFLGIIRTHANRLNALIEDLLALSRIEQGSDMEDILFEDTPIHGVVNTAVNSCRVRAEEQGVTLDFFCPDELKATINHSLLVQALVNLINNAIKFSESGSAVAIAAGETESEVLVSVQDQGPGIDQSHLPRLFERFYRVDKARSRDQGGTGLGLAIVKHIMQVHGGSVTVESRPGHGSTFTLHLPQN
jgi:two-component system phosphate regulon sensor histidine kinase PhoR